MIQAVLQFLGFAALSALVSGLAIFCWLIYINKGFSYEGPRALLSEFLGLGAAIDLVCYSFVTDSSRSQWELLGFALLSIIIGFALSAFFAISPWVPDDLNPHVTELKSDRADLR
jgi:hypothetical protein